MSPAQDTSSSYQPFSDGLRFTGDCGYRIDNDRVIISLHGIANDRPADNLSGSLSVELWALTDVYQGGNFSGFALAATQIGQISGGHWLADCEYDLILDQPPGGDWNLCLMLRESDGQNFETRAWVNFPLLYSVEAPAALADDPIPEVEAVSEVAEVKEETPVVVSIERKRRPVEKQDTPAVKTAKKSKTSLTTVSVNNATEKELASVKGLSKKVAAAIVAGRPYKKLDDLLELKGTGKKMLEKLRPALML